MYINIKKTNEFIKENNNNNNNKSNISPTNKLEDIINFYHNLTEKKGSDILEEYPEVKELGEKLFDLKLKLDDFENYLDSTFKTNEELFKDNVIDENTYKHCEKMLNRIKQDFQNYK